ncbi:MAG: hypothetical protein ACI8VC_002090 [Candidatus Endobugula sp.]
MLRQWEPYLNHRKMSKQEHHRLLVLLYDSIAKYIIPERQDRNEPRAVKRSPKSFQWLTAPRREMKVTRRKGKKYAIQAKLSAIWLLPLKLLFEDL